MKYKRYWRDYNRNSEDLVREICVVSAFVGLGCTTKEARLDALDQVRESEIDHAMVPWPLLHHDVGRMNDDVEPDETDGYLSVLVLYT